MLIRRFHTNKIALQSHSDQLHVCI